VSGCCNRRGEMLKAGAVKELGRAGKADGRRLSRYKSYRMYLYI
jgi:hypothetical protein